MNILITGGAGFVGSHLIDKLLQLYPESNIYVIDNLVRTKTTRNINHILSKITFIDININEFDFSYFSNIKLDYIFHLAATRINRCSKYNLEGHNFIANSGFKIIDFACKNNIKLFFASTASVYQKPKQLPIKEDIPCKPHTIYGSAKLYTENLISSFDNMYGLNYTINRFFSVYGVRMDCEGPYTEVIYNWLNNIKNNKKEITVYGNPDEKILDLVYVDDVVNAIINTTFNTNKETFNVSTECGITLTELIKTVEKVTKTKLNINVESEIRFDVEKARIGDTTKLREIGWKPEINIEQGIERVWEWIKTLKND